jgi:hypothetical protein
MRKQEDLLSIHLIQASTQTASIKLERDTIIDHQQVSTVNFLFMNNSMLIGYRFVTEEIF